MLVIGDDVVAGDEQGRLLVAPLDGSAPPTASAPGTAQIVDAAWGGGTLATLAFDQRMQLWSEAAEPTAIVLGDQGGGAFGLAAEPRRRPGSRWATATGRW